MKKIVMTMLVIGLTAMVAQAAAVHFVFDERVDGTPGTWDVTVEVTGADTAGLASYSIWVFGVDPATVSYAENTLGTMNSDYQPIGFQAANLVQGYLGADFNAGNFQNSGPSAILGIGMVPLDLHAPGDVVPPVILGVPALLGTLTTPPGLVVHYPGIPYIQGGLGAESASCFNETGDGYLPPEEVTVSAETFPIPEPATLSLLAIGGLVMLRRRRK